MKHSEEAWAVVLLPLYKDERVRMRGKRTGRPDSTPAHTASRNRARRENGGIRCTTSYPHRAKHGKCRNRACVHFNWELSKTCICCAKAPRDCSNAGKEADKPAESLADTAKAIDEAVSGTSPMYDGLSLQSRLSQQQCLAMLEKSYGERIHYSAHWMHTRGKPVQVLMEYRYYKRRVPVKAMVTIDPESRIVSRVEVSCLPVDLPIY